MLQGNFLPTNEKHYQGLDSARHQYGISALVTQTSFCEESTGDLAKRRLFSQATVLCVFRQLGRYSSHNSDFRLPFYPHQISESFKKRLLDFHEKAGLVYGAYDFLERGDDVIFLECNSGGAWLWLEHAVGLKVSEHIARYLLGTDENDSP